MLFVPGRHGKVMRLAFPIMLGMLSQSMLNLIDAVLVGHLGEVALAGVGVGGYAMFMLSALVFGLSSSVQSQTAQREGAAHADIAHPLNSGLVIGLVVGLPLSVWAWWQAPLLIGLISQADDVQSVAVDYFRWRVVSLMAIALTLCFRGYWNGRQQTHLYLRIIVAVHLINVAASAGLIYGFAGLPKMGASGAGAGTTLSLFIGLIVWCWVSIKSPFVQHFLTRMPCLATLRTTLVLAAPHSLQQFLFAAGYAVLIWLLSQLGTASVAVGHVLINLSLLLILPGVGIGVAAMSLVGEALGRDAQHEAHRWGLDALRVAWLLLLVLALPMLVIPEQVLGIFFSSSELVALGKLPLQITGVMIVLDAAALVLAQALMGAGAQRTVMMLTLGMQWLLFLPLAWWVGIGLDQGLLGIWLMQLLYRLINSAGFLWVWQRRRWLAPAF
ncbi:MULTISPECIES: MATE family efflux transporter [unclassified Halomonas]|uniref:MATE family efflux transporter n=1 Tax=unclassified Halomonas TaxID=2609666 RepID=UPI0004849F9C|nr:MULTISPECIES: MATE family efflux transporter [unclassified Halomonas]NAO97164.1 MATE family efflux transporter [Halomonas sp. MG34]PKH59516.1 MATE family efflux transporter [Halomonas sp. Choline-3u-9]QGQ70560.1 MATE family efflux transporter [Halomonas sp. PA16-9]